MPDFLLELRSEEIPARMQAGARADLERLFRKEMDEAGVSTGEITVWSTPRRLALIARGLPQTTEAISEELKGPPEGAPDAALDGFCRKAGLTREQLTLRDVKGRATYFAVLERPGRAVKEVLADAIPAIIRAFPWPKSMRWGEASISTGSTRWVRPLSGILALLGEELIECEVHGVTSGWVTLGHRFHHPGDITIGSAVDYTEKLRACHVIVDHEEREALIRDGAAKAAAEAGLTLVEDEGLVVENAGLTEWPVPLLGRFDPAFLEVPPEVIQLTARTNQKYFVCHAEDAQGEGRLANAFVCTANIEAEDSGAAIIDGNRKVLAARLSDARFFWQQDRKKTLEEHAKGLERITFHEKLGTVADKVDRVAKLAEWLASEDIVPKCEPALARKAAELCKADLVTEMVGEFPELQGLMGGYYARAEGLPHEVADAIRDHYKPVGQGDEVPTAPVTVAVSLADKLDTLVGFFAVEEKPTGSKDPFALRRATLAAIELVLENQARYPFRELVAEAYRILVLQIVHSSYCLASNPLDRNFESPLLDARTIENGPAYLSEPFEIYVLSEEPSASAIDSFEDDGTPRWNSGKIRSRGLVYHTLMSFVETTNALTEYTFDRLRERSRRSETRADIVQAVLPRGIRIDSRKLKIRFPGLPESTRHHGKRWFYFPNARTDDDLVRIVQLANALRVFVQTEDGANLLAAYKRAANILKKEEWLGAEGEIARTGEEDPLALVDDPDLGPVIREKMAERHAKELAYTPEHAEKALIEALDRAEPEAAAAVEREDFEAAMRALASLRAPIDRFFDEVTVNDEDEAKRAARLDLLARFRAAVHEVADFSKIEG